MARLTRVSCALLCTIAQFCAAQSCSPYVTGPVLTHLLGSCSRRSPTLCDEIRGVAAWLRDFELEKPIRTTRLSDMVFAGCRGAECLLMVDLEQLQNIYPAATCVDRWQSVTSQRNVYQLQLVNIWSLLPERVGPNAVGCVPCVSYSHQDIASPT